jgi:hypothetical protein
MSSMRLIATLKVAAVLWLGLSSLALAADSPARVIGVFGDSLGDGVWHGLYAVLKAHPDEKLYRYSKVGAGLTRPDWGAWFEGLPKTLDADRITVAVVMFGANDLQSIRDEERKGWLFGTPGWKRTYQARIDKLLAEFAKRKIPVYWLGLPIMRKDEQNAGNAVLNEVLAAAIKPPGAHFLPLIDDFKGKDGAFASHLADSSGHLRQMRLDDGIHFTHQGYEAIADKVYTAITKAPAAVVER